MSISAIWLALLAGSSLALPNTDILPRDTCKTTQAVANDGCFALAKRCGITTQQFQQYNPPGVCDSIQPGKYYCCSAGTLPDMSPQPDSSGTCKTYTVVDGDICDTIAKKNSMTADQIEQRNKNTWGFSGCRYIYPTQKICLSTGSPPMPNPLPNAVCGPQVPGTKAPSDMSTLASLNQCPLNACCDKFGQCGITSEFCTVSPSTNGAPGTSAANTNGCISNCGTDIVNKGGAPASFSRVGYYEAFSTGRKCLTMRPSQIPTGIYTHIHYAFGNISAGFDVDMGGSEDLLEEFKALSGVKKIMSFGGWAFSTEPGTAPIFRQGATDAQRQTFANNVVSFITKHNLDGVDFDWEYPGATDIPGSPPGSKSDGPNYLAFLKLVRAKLPAGKTLSIAAPASYWYLRNFPIKDMTPVLDYIIYMTYDLHGQWDYGNNFTDPGCKAGNCLRSQVNLTETLSALSMITKAGVPTNKLMLGMPLYGRSFQMSQAGCWGQDCTFTGPASGATAGECTNTNGYISNVEIRKILANPNIQKEEHQSEVAGDILVYNSNQWVSWMKPATYGRRQALAKNLNMAGLSDWAIDLDNEVKSGVHDPTPGPTSKPIITSGPGSPVTNPPPGPTSFIYCSHRNADPGQGINSAYCVCDSSTFQESLNTAVTPANSCAYSTKPTSTIAVTTDQTVSTDVPHCKVCTTIGHNQQCSTLSNCTPVETPKPTPTPRCVTAHTDESNCVFDGDIMSLQVWENGEETCKGSPLKYFASDETRWSFDCKNGAFVNITANGGSVHYKASDGYEVDLTNRDRSQTTNYCGNAGGHDLKGYEFEAVHSTDECAKMGCPEAKLCDYRGICDFDAKPCPGN